MDGTCQSQRGKEVGKSDTNLISRSNSKRILEQDISKLYEDGDASTMNPEHFKGRIKDGGFGLARNNYVGNIMNFRDIGEVINMHQYLVLVRRSDGRYNGGTAFEAIGLRRLLDLSKSLESDNKVFDSVSLKEQ